MLGVDKFPLFPEMRGVFCLFLRTHPHLFPKKNLMASSVSEKEFHYRRVFNWATEFSKCKTNEEIKAHLAYIQKNHTGTYNALVNLSHSRYLQDFDIPIETRLRTPISAPPNLLPPETPVTPTRNETPVAPTRNETPVSAARNETPVTPTQQAVKSRKRKVYDKNDYTSIKTLLENNAYNTRYAIPIIPINPLNNEDLLKDIRLQLAKCNNSIGNTNDARFRIAENLKKLTQYVSKDKVKSSFYEMIKDQFNITQR
jgi:hypothetical protein